MNTTRILSILGFALLFASVPAHAQTPLFHSTDPLAPRDEWGVLHQSKDLNPTDYEPRRYLSRLTYNTMGRRTLVNDRAYVGALQVALQRHGYYCGPIDGIYTVDVTDSIARLQKNHSMRVTGTLTVPVRRALHLP